MNLKRTTVQIRDDQHAALKGLVRPGQSLSSVLRAIIDQHFQGESTGSSANVAS